MVNIAYYNLSNLTQADNLVVMTQEVNKLSGYILGLLILIAFVVILFVAFKSNAGIRTIMPIIAFLTTLIGIFLAVMQIIPDFVMYILIVITGGLVLASIFINPEGS